MFDPQPEETGPRLFPEVGPANPSPCLKESSDFESPAGAKSGKLPEHEEGMAMSSLGRCGIFLCRGCKAASEGGGGAAWLWRVGQG